MYARMCPNIPWLRVVGHTLQLGVEAEAAHLDGHPVEVAVGGQRLRISEGGDAERLLDLGAGGHHLRLGDGDSHGGWGQNEGRQTPLINHALPEPPSIAFEALGGSQPRPVQSAGYIRPPPPGYVSKGPPRGP